MLTGSMSLVGSVSTYKYLMMMGDRVYDGSAQGFAPENGLGGWVLGRLPKSIFSWVGIG